MDTCFARCGVVLLKGGCFCSFLTGVFIASRSCQIHMFSTPLQLLHIFQSELYCIPQLHAFSVAFVPAQYNFGKQNPKRSQKTKPIFSCFANELFNKHISQLKSKFSTINDFSYRNHYRNYRNH